VQPCAAAIWEGAGGQQRLACGGVQSGGARHAAVVPAGGGAAVHGSEPGAHSQAVYAVCHIL
jgi:hypothetical protein